MLAVHAVDPLLAEAAATLADEPTLVADAEAELRELAETNRALVPGAPPVVSLVRVGPPALEILSAARDARAALIVMGTQGLGGLRKLFFGSIAEKVLRDTPVPVLAVPLPEGSASSRAPVVESGHGLGGPGRDR